MPGGGGAVDPKKRIGEEIRSFLTRLKPSIRTLVKDRASFVNHGELVCKNGREG